MSFETLKENACSLYDGGWRWYDLESLMVEYDLSYKDAQSLCNELENIQVNDFDYQMKQAFKVLGRSMNIYNKCMRGELLYSFGFASDYKDIIDSNTETYDIIELNGVEYFLQVIM